MRFVRRMAWRALRLLHLDAPARLWRNSALTDEGWWKSYQTKLPVDAFGEPVPWYTYPFRHFVTPRLRDTFRVFEYGGGYSTIWYAHRVLEVVAVEHDILWAAKVEALLPGNAQVVVRDSAVHYVREGARHGLFDVIVIDGIERCKCARVALDNLKETGVVVWDNSEREDYVEGLRLLQDNGFKEIPFDGMGPVNPYSWRTSVFYRRDNCLGI